MVPTAVSVWQALAGGALIGAGEAVLLLGTGRVAGVSGIVGRVLYAEVGAQGWRIAFLLGLVLPALLVRPSITPLASSPEVLAISGLLVGYGTRSAGGCTSGHGVCGIAGGSRRSLVATLLFMGAALLTVAIRHQLVPA
jgi:hypothetical protein